MDERSASRPSILLDGLSQGRWFLKNGTLHVASPPGSGWELHKYVLQKAGLRESPTGRAKGRAPREGTILKVLSGPSPRGGQAPARPGSNQAQPSQARPQPGPGPSQARPQPGQAPCQARPQQGHAPARPSPSQTPARPEPSQAQPGRHRYLPSQQKATHTHTHTHTLLGILRPPCPAGNPI